MNDLNSPLNVPTQADAFDRLVMVVKDQRVHLATASGGQELDMNPMLCGEIGDGTETVGIVDDADVHTLQFFNLCPGCCHAFTADLRERMLARITSQQAITPQQTPRGAEARQMALF